jgi:prepilin-type N-terminal cleavage/methylation domain-containing protein
VYHHAHGRRPGALDKAPAFSLVELVMVVVIIGIVAAIAVPRISRASKAAAASATEADLARVRAAMELYYADHGRYPGYHPGTSAASGDWFVDQLLKYSDQEGHVSDTYTATFRFGPYLRPPFPVNPATGESKVKVEKKVLPAATGRAFGWVSCLEEGTFEPADTGGTAKVEDSDLEDTENNGNNGNNGNGGSKGKNKNK